MKDIHEVLRRKEAQCAQLSKQIEMLRQAADKLREVAPLLAENEEDDSAILAHGDPPLMPRTVVPGTPQVQPATAKPLVRGVAPRWP